MPRYYFHVRDGEAYPDLQGTVLDDLEAAKVEAVRFAGDLLAHNGAKFWDGEHWSMRVVDAMDRPLFEFKFIAVEMAPPPNAANDRAAEK
jgi:hypothetical protein